MSGEDENLKNEKLEIFLLFSQTMLAPDDDSDIMEQGQIERNGNTKYYPSRTIVSPEPVLSIFNQR
jgi:hypothetical protein